MCPCLCAWATRRAEFFPLDSFWHLHKISRQGLIKVLVGWDKENSCFHLVLLNKTDQRKLTFNQAIAHSGLFENAAHHELVLLRDRVQISVLFACVDQRDLLLISLLSTCWILFTIFSNKHSPALTNCQPKSPKARMSYDILMGFLDKSTSDWLKRWSGKLI